MPDIVILLKFPPWRWKRVLHHQPWPLHISEIRSFISSHVFGYALHPQSYCAIPLTRAVVLCVNFILQVKSTAVEENVATEHFRLNTAYGKIHSGWVKLATPTEIETSLIEPAPSRRPWSKLQAIMRLQLGDSAPAAVYG